MRTTIDPPLPCAQAIEGVNGHLPPRLCGRLAGEAILTPVPGDVWELLPVCAEHLQEALDEQNQPPPVARR